MTQTPWRAYGRGMRLENRLLSAVLLLAACGGGSTLAAENPASAAAAAAPAFGSIDAAIAGSHRSAENRARDGFRHPKETLTFFGVKEGQQVLELWPGKGWYTEILAPVLHDHGALTAAAPDNKYLTSYREMLGTRPDIYGNVQVLVVTPPDAITLEADGSADVVLTFRNVHNWVSGGFADAMQSAVFKVLKPGGVYGVVEHRGAPGMSEEQIKKTGYVPEDTVIALVTKAGFVLEERSEINANPKDTKDHPEGVWTLPPSYKLGDKDRAKYAEIGESDRMTLRFRKPVTRP